MYANIQYNNIVVIVYSVMTTPAKNVEPGRSMFPKCSGETLEWALNHMV